MIAVIMEIKVFFYFYFSAAQIIHTIADLLGIICTNRFKLDFSSGSIEYNSAWISFRG